VERAAYHVAVAAAFFPGRAVCLEQSLALYLLLRGRGVPAELRLGVQVYPFYAHAWVELHGEPVNEDRETVEKFRMLPEVAA
jgi:transglutaminase-like putative cysteine protease